MRNPFSPLTHPKEKQGYDRALRDIKKSVICDHCEEWVLNILAHIKLEHKDLLK